MPGVRIHHPELRNCVLRIPHPGEFTKWLKTHNKGRKAKDYHINLDNEGNCIVSEIVWKRLKEAYDSGLSKHSFIVLNEVIVPPTQVVGFKEGTVETPATYVQVQDAIRELAPPGVVTYVTRVDRNSGG